jgi:hypothetical protein
VKARGGDCVSRVFTERVEDVQGGEGIFDCVETVINAPSSIQSNQEPRRKNKIAILKIEMAFCFCLVLYLRH